MFVTPSESYNTSSTELSLPITPQMPPAARDDPSVPFFHHWPEALKMQLEEGKVTHTHIREYHFFCICT